MRKIKFLLFSVLLAGAAFTSCSPEELLDADKPVVTIKANGSQIASVNDKNAGEEVAVVARFEMGAQKDRLEKIKITTVVQGQSFVVLDSTLNDGWFNRGDKFVERNYNISVGQTVSTITFETKDVKGRVGSTTITVAPKGTVIPKVERLTLYLAGQLNVAATYGGFYSVSIDKVFKLKDAVTNAQLVDFVYYYGENNLATLAPISDQPLTTVAGIKDVIGQFNVRNATLFGRATADNYTAGKMPTTTLTADGQTKLVAGDCLAFKTVLGQSGLIRVVSVNGTSTTGTDRSITIDVKVIQ